jgi:hypothetical protein
MKIWVVDESNSAFPWRNQVSWMGVIIVLRVSARRFLLKSRE